MFRFYKCRNVKSPANAYDGSAGYDFFMPEDLTRDILTVKNPHNLYSYENTNCSDFYDKISLQTDNVTSIELNPHGRILIPSGIHVEFPIGYALIAFNKSGIASKKGLIVGSCVIDQNYQGEVHISLINTSQEKQILKAGEKIIQCILVRIGVEKIEEIKSLKELYPIKSARSDGGFGSSGTN